MPGNAAGRASDQTDFSTVGRRILVLLQKRIWLPKLIYSAIPYFYIAAGLSALFATFYIAEWFWVLPHYLLFSFACLHVGVIIFRRRRVQRTSRQDDSGSVELNSLT